MNALVITLPRIFRCSHSIIKNDHLALLGMVMLALRPGGSMVFPLLVVCARLRRVPYIKEGGRVDFHPTPLLVASIFSTSHAFSLKKSGFSGRDRLFGWGHGAEA